MSLLEITDLRVHYGVAQALHGVSISVADGEIAAVIGPVGAGKSTLMDAVFGLNSHTGRITLQGQSLQSRSCAKIVAAGIGYAPERGHLFSQMGVRDNLLVGAYTARDQIEQNLRLVYDLFPVLEQRQSQETGTQSGGERQMVSLGRALMSNPRLLLVDEPTIGLSPKVCLDIASALRRLNAEHGLTILIAEQNVNFALSLAKRVYVMETGRVVREGTPQELQAQRSIRETYFGG